MIYYLVLWNWLGQQADSDSQNECYGNLHCEVIISMEIGDEGGSSVGLTAVWGAVNEVEDKPENAEGGRDHHTPKGALCTTCKPLPNYKKHP